MGDHSDIDHTGLTGVGGSVATDAIFDAKGDLAVGTGANTAAKLTVGANDTIPMADSGQSTGIKWVASQTPSTQAFSDAAAEGTADTYARGDHKHGMPASPGGGALAFDSATVATDQALSSGTSSWVDLATTGPAVTITVNTKVRVVLSCEAYAESGVPLAAMGFAASSGNTIAGSRANALFFKGSGVFNFSASREVYLSGLTPGSTVFTAKYSQLGVSGTVDFQNRTISVYCLD